MATSETISCAKCGQRFPAEDCVPYGSRRVCEDCAMDLLSAAKACDPWAVKMASSSFQTKADAVATLKGVEKRLYEFIVDRGRVPFETLPELLDVASGQVQRAYTTLRHMELLRGHRRGDGGADCVPFDS